MESESKNVKKIKGIIPNVSNVLPTFWVRFPFQIDNGGEWFVLGSRHYLLWNFRVFLAVLYFAFQAFK